MTILWSLVLVIYLLSDKMLHSKMSLSYTKSFKKVYLILTVNHNFCKNTELFDIKYFKIWISTLLRSPHNTNLVTIIRCMTVWEKRRYGGRTQCKIYGNNLISIINYMGKYNSIFCERFFIILYLIFLNTFLITIVR